MQVGRAHALQQRSACRAVAADIPIAAYTTRARSTESTVATANVATAITGTCSATVSTTDVAGAAHATAAPACALPLFSATNLATSATRFWRASLLWRN